MLEQCVAPTCKPFIPRILINSITCLHYCDDLSLRERCQANLYYINLYNLYVYDVLEFNDNFHPVILTKDSKGAQWKV